MNAEFASMVHVRMNDGERWGQAVWNSAQDLYPNVVKGLWGTCLDPFHDDQRVPRFLEFLAWRIES